MDKALRTERESRLQSRLKVLLNRQRIIAKKSSGHDGWVAFNDRLKLILAEELEQTYAASALLLFVVLLGNKRHDKALNLAAGAKSWATNYSSQLANRMTPRLRNKVQRAIDEGTDEALKGLMGDAKANTIATTETTAADVAGTQAAKRAMNGTITDEGELLTIVTYWKTSRQFPDRVCKICRPLDNKPESVWILQFPNGPPAHPICRCELRMVARLEKIAKALGGS